MRTKILKFVYKKNPKVTQVKSKPTHPISNMGSGGGTLGIDWATAHPRKELIIFYRKNY